jgi:hypothetical protein
LKIFNKVFMAAALLGCGLWIGSIITSNADGIITQPGSVDDPIVTKSYVDKSVAALVKQELAESGGGSGGLVVRELKSGDSLIAFEGTEFIVRNGKAAAFSKTSDGVLDVTDGKDLKAGVTIPNHHLLLFPRNDGRGIKHSDASSVTVYVMVRGEYRHVDINGNVVK